MRVTARLPGRIRSLGRFPIPVAVSVALTIYLNLHIAALLPAAGRYANQVSFAAAAAFLAALAMSLWLRARLAGCLTSTLASAAAAAAAALLQFSHGNLFSQDLVVVGALGLMTMVAAHLRRGATIESFWRFNLQLGLAVAMSLVALLVVCAGLSLLVESWSYLFGIRLASSTHSHIWATGAALLAPLFALDMIPGDVDEPFAVGTNPDSVTRAVSYVLNFALVPLVLVYSLTLHIYAGKIALTANMPKGEVGRIVLAFAIIGTITYMIAYPWREIGSRPLRWFMRSWFWLLIVPTVMLTLAVAQRIAEYGVTPERYCLCLFALWLAAMVVYLAAARGGIDLRIIPASLAIALLLSSLGPWGAASVSVQSQLGQLRAALTKRNLLADDQLRLNPPRLATFARVVVSDKHLRSTLFALDDLGALNRIAPMLAHVPDDPFHGGLRGGKLRAALGLSGYGELSRREAARAAPPAALEWADSIALNSGSAHYSKLLGPIWMSRQGKLSVDTPDAPEGFWKFAGNTLLSSSGWILTAGEGTDAASFNLAGVLGTANLVGKSPIVIPAHEGRDRGIVIIVPPEKDSAEIRDQRFELWILLAAAPTPHSVGVR
jgi:Domain of unknown function (DUF4153)